MSGSGGGAGSSPETRYRFLPSVRRGLRPDAVYGRDDGAAAGVVEVTLAVEGSQPGGESETVDASTDVRLYGPGDVVGLDRRQVVRTQPADGATDVAPNYFAHVEFDRPDLPWLFSPEQASPTDGRTRPWLTLVVVEKQDGVSVAVDAGGPLPVLTIRGDADPERELPPADDVWAWAHAQVVGDESSLGRGAVAEALDEQSKWTVSRLVSPRKLEANTAYYACVVPTFEAGRLAGLGEYPADESAVPSPTEMAWPREDSPTRLPVYYHWEFATGPRGDFESLVRALEPRELGPAVGSRPVDLSDPGAEAVAAPWLADGALRLGGALRSVTFDPKEPPYPNPDDPDAVDDPDRRAALRELLAEPDAIEAATGDPVVGPPTYGQWHADVERLPGAPDDPGSTFLDSWLDELNLDPRNRVTAAFGTDVVRANQEALMAAAWAQYGDLTWANELVRAAQVARAVGESTERGLDGVPKRDLLAFTSPMHAQLRWAADADRTIHGRLAASPMPEAVVRPSFRRLMRPRGPLSRRVGGTLAVGPTIDRLAAGTGLLAPGFGPLDSAPTVSDRLVEAGALDDVGELGTAGGRASLLGAGADVLGSFDGARREPDGGTDDPAASVESPLLAATHGRLDSVDEHCLTARRRLRTLESAVQGIAPVDEPETAAETVGRLLGEPPTVADRCAAIAGSTFRPLARSLARLLAGAPEAAPGLDVDRKDAILDEIGAVHVALMGTVGGMADPAWADEPEAAVDDVELAVRHVDRITDLVDELRRALAVGSTTMEYTAGEAPPDVTPLSLTDAPGLGDLVDVEGPLVDMVADRLELSRDWLVNARDDPLEEIMAAPEIDRPMYEPLRDLSASYLCPGVGNIPADTVGVLETNPPFVEAYMVGLSHEMARELLWRRYPTDRRGTYFRHFWDRRAVPGDAAEGPRGDVTPIHWWRGNDLGDNAPVERAGADDDGSRLVLVVRGKLLQRYPNTRIYAVKAVDEDNSDDDEGDVEPDRVPLFEPRRQELLGTVGSSASDVLPDDLGGYSREDLESWAPKEPIFRGTLAEDVTFFGFELDADAAFGMAEEASDVDDRGWFFVLEEPPGEPRFGLDVAAGEDFGSVPHGVSYGPSDGREMEKMTPELWEEGPDVGWNALSWGHLVDGPEALDAKTHVEVTTDRPAGGEGGDAWAVTDGEEWTNDDFDEDDSRSWTALDAATWGRNSAHLARITWQLPVRVAVHADDMLPPEALSVRLGGGGG